jgi:5-methylthioadenosine/S-adenosylhomocysteine deaminase
MIKSLRWAAGNPRPATILSESMLRHLVLPGFVNTHTHAAMTLLRGYADDLPLKEWLETKIWPLEDKLFCRGCLLGSMLAIVE